MGGWLRRAGAAALAGCVAALMFAGVAYAHVEVSADPDVAGANNAVVTFTAEAESPTSGVTSVRIVLPDGITANDVALNKGPQGWTLAADATGYTISGPALPKGGEAVHSIIVSHLPAVRSLTFKALVTYADGTVDRWIEEKSAANPDPDHPAPVLTLRTEPTAGSTTADVITSSPTVVVTPSAAAPAPGGDSGTLVMWIVIGIFAAIAIALGWALFARRRAARSR